MIRFVLILLLLSQWAMSTERHVVRVLDMGGNVWASLTDIEQKLQIRGQWEPFSQSWVWKSPSGKGVRVMAGYSYGYVNGQKFQFDFGPVLSKGSIWVPPVAFLNLLDSAGLDGLSWDPLNKSVLKGVVPNLIQAQAWDHPSGVSALFRFAKPLNAEGNCQGYLCHFYFPLGVWTEEWLPALKRSKRVDTMTMTKDGPLGILDIRFNAKIDTFWAVNGPETKNWQWEFRFQQDSVVAPVIQSKQISVESETVSSDEFVVTRKTAQIAVEEAPVVVPHNTEIKTIVLDPGHGGKDAGASGARKQEKEITLQVALRLKDKLLAKGFKVQLTRTDDRFVPLADRPRMASNWGGDLFLSLHCNAVDVDKEKITGYKAYILRAGGEKDEALARRENAYAHANGLDESVEMGPEQWILHERQLNAYTQSSEDLAREIVEQMQGQVKVPALGTGAGQAGFMVLAGAFMPAVLFEMGFISNRRDEDWMASAQGQEEIAEGLARAIVKFSKKSKS